MEKTKERWCARPSLADAYRDKKVVVHRRMTEAAARYVPIIRAVGEVNVRELLGRDDEDDEAQAEENFQR